MYIWNNISEMSSKSFICGWCSHKVASNKGFYASDKQNSRLALSIYICPHCYNPSCFLERTGEQVPGVPYGKDVKHLPQSTKQIYSEIRKAFSQGAYSLAVMGSRKLIMHVAVEKGASADESFQFYVNYIDEHHLIPPNTKQVVEKIKNLGNETNHQIVLRTREEAQQIILLCELILTFIFEFPNAFAEAAQGLVEST